MRTVRVLLVALPLLLGCHDVTEYTESGEFGAVILDASNLSVVGYVAGMEGARTLAPLSGSLFLVGSADGRLYEVDSQRLEVVRQHRIGGGSSSSVKRMLSSPSASTIYMLTGMGKALEVDDTDFLVLDEFSVGVSPSDACRSPSQRPRIYVSDRDAALVREVYTSNNSQGTLYDVAESPVALAPYPDDPDAVVTAHEGEGGVNLLYLATGVTTEVVPGSMGPFSDVAVASRDTTACAAAPNWNGEDGRLALVLPGGIQPEVVGVSVTGHPTCVCSNPDPSRPYFYAASSSGSNTVVSAVNYLDRTLEMTVTVEGYPWDIMTHRSGEYVIVLTSI